LRLRNSFSPSISVTYSNPISISSLADSIDDYVKSLCPKCGKVKAEPKELIRIGLRKDGYSLVTKN